MALQELLEDQSAAVFMTDYFGRLPFSRPEGCKHLASLGSEAMIERLLAQPTANILVGRGGQSRSEPPPRTLAEARALLAEGFTVAIRQAHKIDPALAGLAESFERDFHAPIDVQVYWTPGGQPGFGWHYDAEEVFILQTQGSKEWRLRKNTVYPWPLMHALPADMRYERERMPFIECMLHADDWLYIPNGYWHRTQAGEESISLSVGVQCPTGLDVYDFLRPLLADSLRWRQRLPVTGEASALSGPELAERYRNLLDELGRDLARTLADERLVQAFLSRTVSSKTPGAVSPPPGGCDVGNE